MRFRLRTLMIVMTVLPPIGATMYLCVAPPPAARDRMQGPIIYQADFFGNASFSNNKLGRVIGLRDGVRLSPRFAEQSRGKLNQFHFDTGHTRTRVVLVEGGKLGDKRLSFRIDEGK